MNDPRVLIVEDDSELRSVLQRGLGGEGFDVTTTATAAELLAHVEARVPDALIVDVGLPDADGRDLTQALRARGVQAPVLFLTARDSVPDRLAGFSAGGDDYLVKPFVFDELVARLRALLRRAGTDSALEAGPLRLDPVTHAVSCNGETATLTPTEFRLLAALVARPGETLRRRELLVSAWPAGAIVHDNTLDVYVARLRRKLRSLPGAPEIKTVHGVGYAIQ
jgi:two-component system response regulator MprA